MDKPIVSAEQIALRIRLFPGQKMLLDSDLARLYGVTTGNLNKAVNRNRARFPAGFVFQLTGEEGENLIFQIGGSKSRGGQRHLPYAFAEQGVAMLSSVLQSARAVKINIHIMRVFLKLREARETNRDLGPKFSELEHRGDKHDEEIAAILEMMHQLIAAPEKPRREIGFHVRERTGRYQVSRRT